MAYEVYENKKARIRDGWDEGGRIMQVLGDAFYVNGQFWYPVLFLDEEDPTFFKSAGIEFAAEKPKRSPLPQIVPPDDDGGVTW